MILFIPILVPAVAALLYGVFGWHPRRTSGLGVVSALTIVACGVIASAQDVTTGAYGWLRVDALSAFMLIVIGAVALLAAIASPSYLAVELSAGHTTGNGCRRYGILTQAFIAAMVLAVESANLGMTWVAIEATTVLTAFLVAHRRTRSATEAAWKYVVICSVGIAVAFLGVVLLNFVAVHADLPAGHGLDLATLTRHGAKLDPGVTRIAVALLILGLGTKAGLAPMHSWLPDAHSKAPAPVSALMSGVLLSVAFYAVLRVKVISDIALGTGFARILLVAASLASLAVAAALLIAQRDYKRMLAYSSIEHMGLMSLGAAIGGPVAAAAVLLHILGHGLAKSVLFIASGHIQSLTQSNRIVKVTRLASRMPLLGGAFGIGVLALLGMPPFSLFASELGIASAGISRGLGWAVIVALVLMLIIVAALAHHTGRMLLGKPDTAIDASRAGGSSLALILGLAACAVLGVTTGPLTELLDSAAAIVGATP